MAERYIRIGSMEDVIGYDDGDYDSAIETDQPIKAGTPIAADDVMRLGDISSAILSVAFPVGCVYLTIVSTSPATLLGFGTWVRIAEGQFLVGFKTADVDFGVVEATGGNKVHTHPADPPSTTSSAPSANTLVDNNGGGTTISVATGLSTVNVDIASFNTGDNSTLPPFFVVYAWKRTA